MDLNSLTDDQLRSLAAGRPIADAPAAAPADQLSPEAKAASGYKLGDMSDDELKRLAGYSSAATTMLAPPPPPPVDILPGMTAAASRGLTFGLSGPIRGAEYATGQAMQQSGIPGVPWLGRQITPPWGPTGPSTGTWAGDYQKSVGSDNANEDQFAKDHSVLAPLAYGAGTALSLPLMLALGPEAAAGGGIAAAAGRGAVTGAGMGFTGGMSDALMNPLEGTWDRAKRVGFGTGIGALGGTILGGGAKAITPYVQNVASRIMPETFGNNLATGRASEAAAAGKVGQPEIDLMNNGTDLTPMDVSESLKKLGGTVFRGGGPAGNELGEFVTNRVQGVGERNKLDLWKEGGINDRVAAATREAFGSDDPLLTEKGIEASRMAAADPLYTEFKAQAPLEATKLQPFMQSPTFRKAVTSAFNDAQDSVVGKTGEAPLTEFFDFNEAGDPIAVKNGAIPPSVLDQIKQKLDENWLTAKRGTDVGDIRRTNGLRQQFVNFLDQEYPDIYAKARSAWAGPSASIDALQRGQQIFKMDAPTIQSEMADMLPEDRDMFRLGAQKAYISRVSDAKDVSNEVTQIAGSPGDRARISAAFDDPAALGRFRDVLGAENAKFQTYKDIRLGSQTAERTAADKARGEGGSGAVGNLLTGAVAMHAEPVVGSTMIAKGLGKFLSPLTQPSENTNSALARLLMSTDPATLTRLLETPRPGSAPTLAGMLAGQGGAVAPDVLMHRPAGR